jgi:hypothetical protein
MDEQDGAAKAKEQGGNKVLSLEQQRKFAELRERRLQILHSQDAGSSEKKQKKKNRRKRKTGNNEPSGSSRQKLGASDQQQHSTEDERPTETVNFGSQRRHVFALTSSESVAPEPGQLAILHDLSVSQSSRPSGGDGNQESMTTESSSAIIESTKTPDVLQNEGGAHSKKKRKKLNWGMEIKARWERKGNM